MIGDNRLKTFPGAKEAVKDKIDCIKCCGMGTEYKLLSLEVSIKSRKIYNLNCEMLKIGPKNEHHFKIQVPCCWL